MGMVTRYVTGMVSHRLPTSNDIAVIDCMEVAENPTYNAGQEKRNFELIMRFFLAHWMR